MDKSLKFFVFCSFLCIDNQGVNSGGKPRDSPRFKPDRGLSDALPQKKYLWRAAIGHWLIRVHKEFPKSAAAWMICISSTSAALLLSRLNEMVRG
jgi:hypothetical protein